MSAMFKLSHTDVADNERHITSIDKFISALKLLIPGWSMLAAWNWYTAGFYHPNTGKQQGNAPQFSFPLASAFP